MKFQYQITIFFIIAAILPLSVFSYVTYNDARDLLIFELSEQLSFSADLTRDNL